MVERRLGRESLLCFFTSVCGDSDAPGEQSPFWPSLGKFVSGWLIRLLPNISSVEYVSVRLPCGGKTLCVFETAASVFLTRCRYVRTYVLTVFRFPWRSRPSSYTSLVGVSSVYVGTVLGRRVGSLLVN